MYNSSDKVIEIQMSKYGVALSGRSRPKEILSNYSISPEELVLLNFNGIEAINHSFANEILSNLLKSKAKIKIINAAHHCESILENELRRLHQIILS